MNGLSERLWYLELQNKALKRQLASFKSGNAYIKLRDEYESILREKDRKIRRLEKRAIKAEKQRDDSAEMRLITGGNILRPLTGRSAIH